MSVNIFCYYNAEYGLKVLNDLEIRTSIPNALNDPFELSPLIPTAQFKQESFEAFLRQDHEVERWYQLEGRKRGCTSKEQFKLWYFENIPRLAAKWLPAVPKNVEDARQSFANTISELFRIICASLVRDSILMWSHYADGHKGLVIEFATGEAPFSQVPEYCILTVLYSEKKVEYFHSEELQELQKRLLAVAATKAGVWPYEQEVRIMIPISQKNLRASRYLPLTPHCITNVYLGCKCSAVDRTLVRSALRRPELPHVGLLHAQLNPSAYALTFEDCVDESA